MQRKIRRLITWFAAAVCLLFVMFMINQVVQLVALADRLSPLLGTLTLWLFTAALAVIVATPVYLWWRLPKTLPPPTEPHGPVYDAYIVQLRQRLVKNQRVRHLPLQTAVEIDTALDQLKNEAHAITRQAALRVFISTAILQNGSLDAFAVLAAQTKMIYDIAKIYDQRPSVAQLVRLYSNVATSAFLARQLDDIDLSEYVQPIVSSAMTAMVGTAVPGVTSLSTVLANSIFSGSANAYLTLRVGVIATMYSGHIVKPNRSAVGRSATLMAAKMIPAVASDGARQVVAAATRAVADTAKGTAAAVAQTVRVKTKDTYDDISKGAKKFADATATTAQEAGRTVVKASGKLKRGLGDAFTGVRGKLRPNGTPVSEPADAGDAHDVTDPAS